MTVHKKVFLRFDPKQVDKPILYTLIKEYDLTPNILKAEINPHKEGYLVMDLAGEDSQYAAAMEFLNSLGIAVDALDKRVVWLEDKCMQCGACTGLCPTQALSMNRPSMEVSFDGEKCIVCELCLKICPVRAVELHF